MTAAMMGNEPLNNPTTSSRRTSRRYDDEMQVKLAQFSADRQALRERLLDNGKLSIDAQVDKLKEHARDIRKFDASGDAANLAVRSEIVNPHDARIYLETVFDATTVKDDQAICLGGVHDRVDEPVPHAFHGSIAEATKGAVDASKTFAKADDGPGVTHVATALALFGQGKALSQSQINRHGLGNTEEARRRSAAESNVVAVMGFKVECDKKPYAGLRKLHEIGLVPSIVIASGGLYVDEGAPFDVEPECKLHDDFLFKGPVLPPNFPRVKRIAKRLAAWVGSDETFSSLVHMARLPGGTHRKNEGTCRPVQIMSLTERRYTLDEIEEILDRVAPETRTSNGTKFKPDAQKMSEMDELLETIGSGATGGVHDAIVRYALQAYQFGHTETWIESLLFSALDQAERNGRDPVEVEAFKTRDVPEAIRSAVEKAEGSEAFQNREARREQTANARKTAKDADALEEVVSAINEQSTTDDIDALLVILAHVKDTLKVETILRRIVQATGKTYTVAVLKSRLKDIKQAHRISEAAGRPTDELGIPVPPDDLSEITPIWREWGYKLGIEATKKQLTRLNDEVAFLFRSGDGFNVRLTSVPFDGGFVLKMQVLGSPQLAALVNDKLHFKKIDRDTQRPIDWPCESQIVSDLVNEATPAWPVLERLSHVPLVAPDGKQVTRRGYIPELRTYLDTDGGWLNLPDVVTSADVELARARLFEVIRDFAFADWGVDRQKAIKAQETDDDGFHLPNLDRGRGSRANAIALLIAPFVRHLIDGPTPAFAITKPVPGSGAGYLVDAATLIASGDRPPVTPMSESAEEVRKTITASLLEGPPILFLDNITSKIVSGDIAGALTAGIWSDRILGRSEKTRIRIRNTWVLAGNSLRFSDEIAQRMVPILLDTRTKIPRLELPQSSFKHRPLHDYVLGHRRQLVWAINVLIKHWIDRDRPAGEVGLASFDSWSAVMSGVLSCAGVEGLLSNVSGFLEGAIDQGINTWTPTLTRMLERYLAQLDPKNTDTSYFKADVGMLWACGVGSTFVDAELEIKRDRDGTNALAWSQALSKPPACDVPFTCDQGHWVLLAEWDRKKTRQYRFARADEAINVPGRYNS